MSAEYWEESVSYAFDALGKYDVWNMLTREQQKEIGEALVTSHENYGMAHYSPPASDRFNDMERQWQQRLDEERDRTEAARKGAEIALRRVLRVHRDDPVSFTDAGEVYRHGGRTERIA